MIKYYSFDEPEKNTPSSDEQFMREALRLAQVAFEEDEIPIGAIIVAQNRIIAKAYNLTERLNDVTAHAEMQAFTSASNFLGGKYLRNCTLYVTIEPCIMCAGASYWSQIGRIVYGARDVKRGYQNFGNNIIHPKTEIVGGILEQECAQLIQTFFRNKRK